MLMASSPLRELEAISGASARDCVLVAIRRGGGAGMVETPDKVAALMDATRAFAAMGAPHALVGGVAVGVHSGVPRATADTDIAGFPRSTGAPSPRLSSAPVSARRASSVTAPSSVMRAASGCEACSTRASTR